MDLRSLPLLRDDKKFISRMMKSVSSSEARRLLTEYKKRWLEAAENEPTEQKKDNAGRMAANTYIRVEVENGA